MTDYSDTLCRHRRIAILRFLEASGGYTANSSILTDTMQALGVTSTYDQVVTDLEWLAEQRFVTLVRDGDFVVAMATARGVEIALGRATHPGVQRPRPRG